MGENFSHFRWIFNEEIAQHSIISITFISYSLSNISTHAHESFDGWCDEKNVNTLHSQLTHTRFCPFHLNRLFKSLVHWCDNFIELYLRAGKQKKICRKKRKLSGNKKGAFCVELEKWGDIFAILRKFPKKWGKVTRTDKVTRNR